MKKACYSPLTWLAFSTGILMSGAAYGVNLYTIDTEEPEPRQSEMVLRFDGRTIDEDANASQVAETLGFEDTNRAGAERFYWENSPDSDWRIYMDGRWLVNPDEVALSIEAFKPEVLYVNVDFQHWVEYDYGAGVWYPPTGSFFTLAPDLLPKKISKFKLTLRATPSDEVEWKFGYSYFNRDGASLTTSFGDDYQYIIGRTVSRGIVPGRVDTDETVHTFELGGEYNDDLTRGGMRLHFQRREIDRTKAVERAASQPGANRYTTDKESTVDDLFGFSAYLRKPLRESLYGSVGLSSTRLDGDVTGSRIFGANPEAMYDIDFAALQLDDRGYLNLDGTRELEQWIMNANLVYDPESNFRLMAGVRFEHLSTQAFNSYLDTVYQVDWSNAAFQRQEAVMSSGNDKRASDISGFLEIRYKGIPKATVYSRLEGATQTGSLNESWDRQEIVPDDGLNVTLLDRASDFDRVRAFWETGVNYYPLSSLKISLEGYLKYREYEYGYGDLLMAPEDWTLYPGYLEEQTFYTRDINARIHWRIFSSLKSVTRIDLQDSSVDSKDYLNPEIESSDRERVVFNQSLTWTPHPRFFVTAAYHLVDDLAEGPAADMEGTFSGIIVNVPNDYWQADVDLYYVVTKLIDIQLGYHYMEVSNYLDNSPKTVPYGSEIEQHHGSAAVILHFNPNLTARIGYHYFEQTDLAAMGLRDYSVHVVNSSLQMKF
ncbi:MAG TPA: hypothetical protein VK995_04815 [Oceanipulchritudo sp.]|nr:hypothetical protein [Oceanipulchritudo sp.]